MEEEKEALEDKIVRDQHLFEVVGVIKEREQLMIMVDIEIEADVKDSSECFPGRNTMDSYLWLTQN